jgi:hypothetical protein
MKLTSVIAGMAASSLSLLQPWYARAATPRLISRHHSVKQQREQQHPPAIPDGLQIHSMANTLLTPRGQTDSDDLNHGRAWLLICGFGFESLAAHQLTHRPDSPPGSPGSDGLHSQSSCRSSGSPPGLVGLILIVLAG